MITRIATAFSIYMQGQDMELGGHQVLKVLKSFEKCSNQMISIEK